MTSKFNSIVFFIALVAVVGASSCEKDDVTVAASPVISNLEVGHHNSLTAQAGTDLHMEAEVVAEGNIEKITVEIHKEDGTGDEMEAEYTDYAGLKNATFHKHIDIPAGAAAGEYHFHLTVTDQQGNSTSVDRDIMVVQ